ncbi:hypothetical protein K440DRAFT_641429 [Wilcoxina mikolae CBS 423.85]|nr:hypothetical protein K440DRAFT_641429 [Wilcoxina mikolae CBS 423.85]
MSSIQFEFVSTQSSTPQIPDSKLHEVLDRLIECHGVDVITDFLSLYRQSLVPESRLTFVDRLQPVPGYDYSQHHEVQPLSASVTPKKTDSEKSTAIPSVTENIPTTSEESTNRRRSTRISGVMPRSMRESSLSSESGDKKNNKSHNTPRAVLAAEMGCASSGSAEVRRRRAIVKEICEKAGYPLTKALGKYGKDVKKFLIKAVVDVVNGPDYKWGWSEDVTRKVLMATAWDTTNTLRKAKQQKRKYAQSKRRISSGSGDDESGSQYGDDEEFDDQADLEYRDDPESAMSPNNDQEWISSITVMNSNPSKATKIQPDIVSPNIVSDKKRLKQRGYQAAPEIISQTPSGLAIPSGLHHHINPEELLVFRSVDENGKAEWKPLSLENVFEDLVAKSGEGITIKKVSKKVRALSGLENLQHG